MILRRGPSKSVALIAWDTHRDTFEVGQWLRGRIFERRCDLSPSGVKLVYFAASWRGPFRTWTAVSRPPWLTALALWPNSGTYGGGGLFLSETRIALNHRSTENALAEGFSVPTGVEVTPMAPGGVGEGEDLPIDARRAIRDGWTIESRGTERHHDAGAKLWIEYDPPWVMSRRSPANDALVLRSVLRGIHERGGRSYVLDHSVTDDRSRTESPMEGTDWADWD